MSFYLAAKWAWKEDIAAFKKQLEGLGFHVTSTWTEEDGGWSIKEKHEYHERMATRDLEEIDAADVLVLFTIEPTEPFVRGGRHVEFGYALGKGKFVCIVGPKENIFHHLPNVKCFADWNEFLNSLPRTS